MVMVVVVVEGMVGREHNVKWCGGDVVIGGVGDAVVLGVGVLVCDAVAIGARVGGGGWYWSTMMRHQGWVGGWVHMPLHSHTVCRMHVGVGVGY